MFTRESMARCEPCSVWFELSFNCRVSSRRSMMKRLGLVVDWYLELGSPLNRRALLFKLTY